MTSADDILTSTWLLVEGFPLLLAAVLCIGLALVARVLASEFVVSQRLTSSVQNRYYKRAAVCLLLAGAVGGFLPSIIMLAKTGQVWSVNHQAPHTLVDRYLLVHIPLSVLWAMLVGLQLWSAQVAKRRRLHIRLGWMTMLIGVFGIGLMGGIVWPLANDFADGLASPSAGAGIYTMVMGLGVILNSLFALRYARAKNFDRHRDHVLMTLFWTMDPGLHRLYMWVLRWLDSDLWAPEQTGGMGIAIAKLPANLTLIFWALGLALLCRRLNGIVWSNVIGQFALWCLGMMAVVNVHQGQTMSILVLSVTSVAFLATWGLWRRSAWYAPP